MNCQFFFGGVFKLNIILISLFTQSSFAQPGRFGNRAKAIIEAVNLRLYDKNGNVYLRNGDNGRKIPAHLWDLCALLQAANEVERLKSTKGYLSDVIRSLTIYYDSGHISAYRSTTSLEGERYYDDNEWLGIAFLDIYKRTGNNWFLNSALNLYKFMMTGYDNRFDGIFWKEQDRSSKNACSNAPAILLSLRLYDVTGDKEYLFTALKVYNWLSKYLRDESGLYFDAIKYLKSISFVDKSLYSYNTGAMLEANVALYKATKEVHYLSEAQRIAKSAHKYFFLNGVKDSSYWFNAVLLRGYEALYYVDRNERYISAYSSYAEDVWLYETDSQNLVGRGNEKELLDQAGMIEIYARLARLESL